MTADLNADYATSVNVPDVQAYFRAYALDGAAAREALPFDPAKLVVSGHSAGGHLAAMCAVTIPVIGVATISGLHDLVPIVRTSNNDALQLDDATARALSPIHFPPAGHPSVFATAGELESAGFRSQGQRLADVWAAHGCPTAYADGPNDNHFSIVQRLADQNDALTSRIIALFG